MFVLVPRDDLDCAVAGSPTGRGRLGPSSVAVNSQERYGVFLGGAEPWGSGDAHPVV